VVKQKFTLRKLSKAQLPQDAARFFAPAVWQSGK
jgi:hypothetical protein